MTNPNLNLHGNQTTGLAKVPLKANIGEPIGILRMLAVLILGIQTKTKVTMHLRGINGKKWTREDNKR